MSGYDWSSLIITVLGGIASVWGAVIAIKQARQAKKSAETAWRIQNQLIRHREVTELSTLQYATKRVQKTMTKYGPAATRTSIIGADTQADANEVQEFLILLKDNRNLFGDEVPNEVDVLCDKISNLIESLLKSTNFEQKQKYGKQLLMHLNNFSPIVKRRLENSNETFDTSIV